MNFILSVKEQELIENVINLSFVVDETERDLNKEYEARLRIEQFLGYQDLEEIITVMTVMYIGRDSESLIESKKEETFYKYKSDVRDTNSVQKHKILSIGQIVDKRFLNTYLKNGLRYLTF